MEEIAQDQNREPGPQEAKTEVTLENKRDDSMQNVTLLTTTNLLTVTETFQGDETDAESYRHWRPPNTSTEVPYRLRERRIFRLENGLHEPRVTIRVPVEIYVFGKRVRGILDSGSERSYLSEAAYDRVKDLQIKDPVKDATSENGVRLGDKSTVKTMGGTCFIIDVGDVYGPQWFSILPTLSSDLVLGMDFGQHSESK